jgi:hypothetical protein
MLLLYLLADKPSWSLPYDSAAFIDRQQVHWLYDEVDILEEQLYTHEILFSNGRVLRLAFVAFDMLTISPDDLNVVRADRIGALTS